MGGNLAFTRYLRERTLMLARFKRAAAVGVAACLVLLIGSAPLAAAEETAPPEVPVVPDQPGDSPATPEEITPAAPTDPVETTDPGETTDPVTQGSPAADEPQVETEEPSEPAGSTPASDSADEALTPQSMAAPMPAAALDACTGVWVAVQVGDDQPVALDCVESADRTALDLLSSVHDVGAPGGFVNQINGFPENTEWDPDNPLFWNFCTATASDAGDLTWLVAGQGTGAITPAAGSAIGFRWAAWPDDAPQEGLPAAQCPTVSWVPAGPTGSRPDPVPPRDPATANAVKAAEWLANNPADADDVDGLWQSIIGMATVDQCQFAPAVTRDLARLAAQADDYTQGNSGRAARLAIVAAAVGQDPTNFGGVDLIARTTAGLSSFVGNPFSASLAIIALSRAGEPVPDALLEALLDSQAADGVFGFGAGSGFFPDPDSTGLAMVALSTSSRAGATAALDRAVAWAQANQLADGSWENWVPVNTTSLLSSALELVDADAGDAQDWLKSQQLANGALPDERDGSSADRFSTAEGLFGLTGTTYLTVSFDFTDCADEDVEGGDTRPGELPNTGASDATGMLGILSAVLIAAGGGLVVLRQRQQA